MHIYVYYHKNIHIYIDMNMHQVRRTYVCLYPCMDAYSADVGALAHTHKRIPTHAYTHTQIETYITFFPVSL